MERLLELVNSLTADTVNADNTVVSLPEEYLGKENTVVTLQGRLDAGSYGERQFKYNRINLRNIGAREIYWQNETNLLELLPKINSAPIFVYTLGPDDNIVSRQGFLKSSDIVNESFSMSAGQSKTITLKAHPESYLFVGELSLVLLG